MVDNIISVRLSDQQMQDLEALCLSTGWTYSQVFRAMLDNVNIRPASIKLNIDAPAKQTEPVK